MRMKLALAFALLVTGATAASAADNWVGAWGFVPITPAPNPVAVTPPTPAQPVPMAEVSPVATPNPPLLENPGNVPLQGNGDLVGVTVRQLVRVSVGGSQIRLRFSNEASGDVLSMAVVHVAQAAADGRIVPGTDHAVTFDGKAGVVIPASSPLLSDPVTMPVKALDRLLISVHLPGIAPRAGHALMMYVSSQGNHTAATALPDVRLSRVTALVTQIDVNAAPNTGVIVTLGDSITEGAASTANAFRGWPDRLAERLTAARKSWGVVNAGIGGNRLLRYGTGQSALARLDRDVLSVSGIKAIILLEGINDIGVSFNPATPRDPVTAEALIAADKQIIARAHARGIKVYGAILTPYQGAGYASPAGEQVRQALNQWIRTSGAFDGVIDFATPTADPANPLTFDTRYNLSDKLHPNDAGYQAMANAIDLEMITK